MGLHEPLPKAVGMTFGMVNDFGFVAKGCLEGVCMVWRCVVEGVYVLEVCSGGCVCSGGV